MKYSVCIDMMFPDFDFYDRFEQVKKTGINTVEFWKWSDKDIEKVAKKLKENDVSLSIFNIDSANKDLSFRLSRGILNTGDTAALEKALLESIPVYRKWNAAGMIVLIGEEIPILSYETQIENIKKCLKGVAPLAEKENINLFVEPLNSTDRKNYFLTKTEPLLEILTEVNSKNIKMLFDIYHQYMSEDNVVEKLIKNIDLIGHFHVADCPGRHEIGTGNIDYKDIFCKIGKTDYSGFIGFEYRGIKNDAETLREWNV